MNDDIEINSILLEYNIENNKIYLNKYFLAIIGILFSFMICDMYYVLNDNQCINNRYDNSYLTIYKYLLINSIFWIMIFINIIIFMIYYCKNNNFVILNEFVVVCSNVIYKCLILFNIIWTIIGSIIFWGYFNITTCSLNIYVYLFISLISKLVIAGFSIFSNK